MAASTRTRRTAVAGAITLTALLGIYVWLVAARAIALIGTGKAIGIVLGIAFLVLPLVVIWLIVREWMLAIDVQRMADELAAADALPIDDLPRSPGGRIDRAVARDAFETARTAAEEAPDDWRSWYNLAFAYDAAGDRRRARASLRTARRFYRGKGGDADIEIR